MRKVIALEGRLKGCRNVMTLGVRPNFCDYTSEEAALIRGADKIYYPSPFYADLFNAKGVATFPSYHTYKCTQDKIKQTALFNLLEIPHPHTRVFYGRRDKEKICRFFEFPFIAKIPRGSAMGRGVYLIEDSAGLEAYLSFDNPAYIQEYLPVTRDIRVIIIGTRPVLAYWRIAAKGEYRCNVSAGAAISFEDVPGEALRLALFTAKSCGWDDVGIDICMHNGSYYVLEGNMKYGRAGFRQAGQDYMRLMEQLIEEGVI